MTIAVQPLHFQKTVLNASSAAGLSSSPAVITSPALSGASSRSSRLLLNVGMLMGGDVLSALLSLVVATSFVTMIGGFPLRANGPFLSMGTAGLAALLLSHAVLGLYPGFGLRPAERLRRRWISAWIVTPLFALAAAVVLSAGPGIALIGLTGAFTLLISPLAEDIVRSRLHRRGLWGQPVTLLCSDEERDSLTRMLHQVWQLGCFPASQAGSCAVVVATPDKTADPAAVTAPTLLRVAGTGDLTVLRAPILLSWYSRRVGWIRPANPRRWPWNTLKRTLDCALGAGALLLAAPLMLLVVAAIYAVDPGPVLYGQFRRGLHGRPVRIWKLRSMYQDSQRRLERLLAEDLEAATEWYARFKLTRDPRVLPWIGAFIRKHSIDELPQLWNVLKGELSLVGPRVFVDYDLDVYEPEDLLLRQSVVPGITGLWQISVRSDGDNRDKAVYDTAYVRQWSFWLDLDILYRTVGVVLTGRGAV